MIVTDLAALALVSGGMVAAARGSHLGSGLVIGGLGTYVLGGPIVHLTEEGAGKGFASLGLRLGAPLMGAAGGTIVGGVIGSQMSCGDKNDTCGLVGLALGAVVGFASGALVAMAVDDATLAYRITTPKALALRVTPFYQPATRQSGLALLGTW